MARWTTNPRIMMMPKDEREWADFIIELENGMTTDYYAEVAAGNIPGASLVHKFGRNDAVPNGSWAHVSQVPFATANFLSAVDKVRIKADAGASGNDAAAGTGARTIIVQGIDSNGDESQETITTNGTAKSTETTTQFWRIHRAWVSTAGSGEVNEDTLVIEDYNADAGGTDLIQITASEGQSQYAGWSVPRNKKAYLLSVHVTVDASAVNKRANIRMFTRADLNDVTAPVKSKRLKLHWDGIQGEFVYKPHSPGSVISEWSDIWFEAYGDGAQTEVSIDFELLVLNA